jgi:hypothetical protein
MTYNKKGMENECSVPFAVFATFVVPNLLGGWRLGVGSYAMPGAGADIGGAEGPRRN